MNNTICFIKEGRKNKLIKKGIKEKCLRLEKIYKLLTKFWENHRIDLHYQKKKLILFLESKRSLFFKEGGE